MNRYSKNVSEFWHGKLLGSFLLTEMQLSKRMIRRLKSLDDGILVNGVPKTVRYMLKFGETVSVASTFNKQVSYESEALDVAVCYEDEDYFVVDKPPYMTMYPRYLGEKGSLANFSKYYLEKNGGVGGFFSISRLDKGTSGLVLLAKTAFAASALRKCKITKYYHTLVTGECQEHGILTNYLKQAPYSGMRDGALFEVHEHEGEYAQLVYNRLFYHSQKNVSGVLVALVTGRRHQIRVQFSHLGHTILGDVRYGSQFTEYDRPLLHSTYLSFTSPISNKLIQVSLPLHSYHESDHIKAWEEYFEKGELNYDKITEELRKNN